MAENVSPFFKKLSFPLRAVRTILRLTVGTGALDVPRTCTSARHTVGTGVLDGPQDLQKPHGFTCRMEENAPRFRFYLCVLRGRRIRSLRCRLLMNPGNLGGRSLRSIPPKNPFVCKASATTKKIYVAHSCALPLILKLHCKFS